MKNKGKILTFASFGLSIISMIVSSISEKENRKDEINKAVEEYMKKNKIEG